MNNATIHNREMGYRVQSTRKSFSHKSLVLLIKNAQISRIFFSFFLRSVHVPFGKIHFNREGEREGKEEQHNQISILN